MPSGSCGRAGASALRQVSPGTWDRLFGLAPASLRIPTPGDKIYKLADVATADPDEFYRRLAHDWTQPAEVASAIEPGHRTFGKRILWKFFR